MSKNLVVIGAQWGDEGKGRFTDYLSQESDFVVRYQGGHNAGHRIVVGDDVFALQLVPSGSARSRVSRAATTPATPSSSMAPRRSCR